MAHPLQNVVVQAFQRACLSAERKQKWQTGMSAALALGGAGFANAGWVANAKQMMRWGPCWYGQAAVNRSDAGSIPATAA